jgi:hypothetical protein
MQFNNSSSTELSLISHIDFLLWSTGATLNTDYSLADRTRNINAAWDDVVVDLFKADPNFIWDDLNNTTYPVATTPLVANRTHYTILDSMLVISRVRAKDRNGTYRTLTPRNRDEISDDVLNSSGEPTEYYNIGGSLFPVAIPDYSYAAGLEVQFKRGGNHFTIADTTKEPGFASQFHQILAIKAAKIYAIANGLTEKVNMLTGLEKEMQMKMIEFYQRRNPDDKPGLRLKSRNMTMRAGLN